MKEEVPVPKTVVAAPKAVDPKLNKVKVAFLYVLIGGLVVSALISVIAILSGTFNEVFQKALLTTFIFMTHSLLILTFVSADRHNTIGKDVLPTTIFAVIVANMFTTTFGTWGIWDNDTSWRAFLLYMLVIGSAFVASLTLKLRIQHQITRIVIYVTVALIALLMLVLVPWVFAPHASWLGSFYYRLISAITILAATSLSLSVIFNRIAISQHPELRPQPRTRANDIPGGMLAIYIVIGTIVGFSWLLGLFSLIASAATIDQPTNHYNDSSYYDRYE